MNPSDHSSMANSQPLHLRVFLASPGGVAEERAERGHPALDKKNEGGTPSLPGHHPPMPPSLPGTLSLAK